MEDNTVTVSGMFGNDKTYFAGSPVVIDINGMEWPASSPFNIVRVNVIYDEKTVGDVHADTGGQSSFSFDIESALRAIWAEYGFGNELAAAKAALTANAGQTVTRAMREYALRIDREYMSSDGKFTPERHGPFTGGKCLIGTLTEWERYNIEHKENADVSALEHTGVRNGDASTKPTSSPERVGRDSITSWVDVQAGYTKSIFYPAPQAIQLPSVTGDPDDIAGSQQGWTGHAPTVLRDSIAYTDFLFVNRRGAVETCSALMKESMGIDVESRQYSHVERPAFKPTRSLMTVATGGRRSWAMSSGFVTREWAEWWTLEFLMAKKVWMRYKGPGTGAATFVPVTVKPAKNSTTIYDRAKQQMPSVEFTVTLALEG